MSRAVVLAYAVCALIWGTTWYAIRVCIAPGGYPTLLGLALRFAIAALVIVPFALRARPWPTGRAWLYLALAGVLDAGAYLLVYLGEERVPGGVAAVVYGTQPLILALLLGVARMERTSKKQLLGAVISLGGVGVLFADRFDISPAQALGVALVLGSVVVSTTYSMIVKRHATGVPNVVATAIFLGITALVLGIVGLAARDGVPWPPPVEPTIALLYLALIGSFVAFLTYFWLLDRTSLHVTSTLVFVFPLVALAADAMFERDVALGVRGYAGVALTLAGLAVSLRRG